MKPGDIVSIGIVKTVYSDQNDNDSGRFVAFSSNDIILIIGVMAQEHIAFQWMFVSHKEQFFWIRVFKEKQYKKHCV